MGVLVFCCSMVRDVAACARVSPRNNANVCIIDILRFYRHISTDIWGHYRRRITDVWGHYRRYITDVWRYRIFSPMLDSFTDAVSPMFLCRFWAFLPMLDVFTDAGRFHRCCFTDVSGWLRNQGFYSRFLQVLTVFQIRSSEKVMVGWLTSSLHLPPVYWELCVC